MPTATTDDLQRVTSRWRRAEELLCEHGVCSIQWCQGGMWVWATDRLWDFSCTDPALLSTWAEGAFCPYPRVEHRV